MKESKFEKNFAVSGSKGSVGGKIVVKMNYDTKEITGTHFSTHDNYVKNIPLHKVEGYIKGNLVLSSILDSEDAVLKEVKSFEDNLKSRMRFLADNEPILSFADKMNALGF